MMNKKRKTWLGRCEYRVTWLSKHGKVLARETFTTPEAAEAARDDLDRQGNAVIEKCRLSQRED